MSAKRVQLGSIGGLGGRFWRVVVLALVCKERRTREQDRPQDGQTGGPPVKTAIHRDLLSQKMIGDVPSDPGFVSVNGRTEERPIAYATGPQANGAILGIGHRDKSTPQLV